MKSTTKNYLIMGAALLAFIGFTMLGRMRSHSLAEQLPDDRVVGKGCPIVLQFGAHWCPPCRKQLPVMVELSKEDCAFQTAFVDVDDYPQAARDYEIGPIPTLIFFDSDDVELFRQTGFYPKENILAKWKELGVE